MSGGTTGGSGGPHAPMQQGTPVTTPDRLRELAEQLERLAKALREIAEAPLG